MFELAIAGLSLMACVWKLKGPRDPPGGGGGPILPSELSVGVEPAEDTIGDAIPPNRLGNESLIGDRAFGSKVTVVRIVWGPPLPPKPSSGSSGIGVGGVGVLGGAGIGRLDAMADLYEVRGSMRESAKAK